MSSRGHVSAAAAVRSGKSPGGSSGWSAELWPQDAADCGRSDRRVGSQKSGPPGDAAGPGNPPGQQHLLAGVLYCPWALLVW